MLNSILEKPINPIKTYGKIKQVVNFLIIAQGIEAQIGCYCKIFNTDDNSSYSLAKVIGFKDADTYLMSTCSVMGLKAGQLVLPTADFFKVPLGQGLIGRVIDANAKPLDNKGELKNTKLVPLDFAPINPLERKKITQVFDVGVKAINGFITVGQGQRMGLFAGSGVGKSVLMGMMTKFSACDVIVIGLIGERGREVKEFIEDNLGPQGLAKTIVVAEPSDSPPLSRIQAAEVATFIAEYFRDKNKNVLLLIDSVTRYAHALREVGLLLGEPPTQKGYPPSVFSKLPKLIERAGNLERSNGSLTAIYTVLADGDDNNDPIVDAARGILDGHIMLSRKLAESGHFPAIDLDKSISRLMDKIVSKQHLGSARNLRKLKVIYDDNKDFMTMGAYVAGQDKNLDIAIKLMPMLTELLQQYNNEKISYHDVTNLIDHINRTYDNLLK